MKKRQVQGLNVLAMRSGVRTSRPIMAIFLSTTACRLAPWLGHEVSAFVGMPGVSKFHQRKPQMRQPLLLLNGGGLDGRPAEHTTAGDDEVTTEEGSASGGGGDTRGDGEEGRNVRWCFF